MRELDKALGQNEKVFWEGTPSFWPFLLGGSIVTTIFGLSWMLFLVPFIGLAVYDILFGSHIFGFGILLLPHFWIGIGLVFGIPIYQVLVFKHTYYAITDKRVILQKGWIGRDFEMIDFDQITNVEVNVGFFDKFFGSGNTGSILVFTAGLSPKSYVIRSIVNPYDIFKFLKKVTHDVKTDIQYPNKFRPGENSGYQSNYDPNKK
ncbi:PH domain-containing protein [Candidatus Wolfebacteria bacterium]|nr:PH domain-containing protein [Candidatus Wolfebacteria bacterium]